MLTFGNFCGDLMLVDSQFIPSSPYLFFLFSPLGDMGVPYCLISFYVVLTSVLEIVILTKNEDALTSFGP